MLRQLIIRDFVIVDTLELDFDAGFGALTGETGAGKSILIDALALALGERADAGLVRVGCDKAEVTACFDIASMSEVGTWLAANDLDAGDELFLRRVIDAGGRSRAYINGSPATAQQLREVAENLVDIHGQHAHQSLLRTEAQRSLLDEHAGLGNLARSVATAFSEWRRAENRLSEVQASGAALLREREQLEWQVRELDTLAFHAEEWAELEHEHRRLAHAAGLIQGVQFALAALAEGEGTCEGQVDSVVTCLEEVSTFDPALQAVFELMQSVQAELSEAISALRRYASHVDLDPARLREVERRIDAVLTTAQKYRCQPSELPALLAGWRARLSELGEAGDLAALTAKAQTARATYLELAKHLSVGRRQAADKLSSAVSGLMQQLALGSGRLLVALLPLEEGSAHGLEQVEFRVSGLAGNEAKPLAKVVSGGELSRISLAIQVVTSRSASVPTLLFDEVDVGIGGGVAEIVGRMLHELGQERQVLCVTHLPQVAACANWQWQVSKMEQGGSVRSRIDILNDAGRIEEIARMLGGVEITEITRKHAEELLFRR